MNLHRMIVHMNHAMLFGCCRSRRAIITIAIVKMVRGTLNITIIEIEYASPTEAFWPPPAKLSLHAGQARASIVCPIKSTRIGMNRFMMQAKTIDTT